MKYLLLVHQDAQRYAALLPDGRDALMRRCRAHAQALRRAGKLLASERLQEPPWAITLRVRDGRLSATDGPYAETQEQLGGFILIDAADLDEAIRIAAAFPWTEAGSIEVRPLLELAP